ncbi:MAG: hypothetical protein CM1200mP12_00280 [Gammaproteobacteria bacterium]|nr:MAG: hypothetical protein CM1200mP12_00280 [Gammaproteobacteria bacterium]
MQGLKKFTLHHPAPPIRHQNVYGIDMAATTELIAHNQTRKKKIGDHIGP